MAHESEGQGVYPELDELIRLKHIGAGLHFLPRQPITSLLSGRHASRLRGRGLNFEEIRGYRPGDDTRNMDWKATVRLRKPQVRVYTEERDRATLLVVDLRTTMFFGSRRKMKSVVAAEAAALAAWRVLDQDDRVGAVLFSDTETVFVRPRRSPSTVMRILAEIVRLGRALRATPRKKGGEGTGEAATSTRLNEALHRAARSATHDHLVCVISDLDGMDGETERLFKTIAAHNDLFAIGVFDPIGRLLPRAGRLTFAREGVQVAVDTGAKRVRERFRDRFDARARELQTFFRRMAVPLLLVTPEREVVDQVLEQLGQARPGR